MECAEQNKDDGSKRIPPDSLAAAFFFFFFSGKTPQPRWTNHSVPPSVTFIQTFCLFDTCRSGSSSESSSSTLVGGTCE